MKELAIMEKKQYMTPGVEIMLYQAQSLMKVGSDLPDDPNTSSSAPKLVPALGNDSIRVF